MEFVLALLLLVLPSSALSSRHLQTGALRTSRDLKAQPIKVVVSDTCAQDGAHEKQLDLDPDSPLVLTHRIRLVPATVSGCGQGQLDVTGLRERVERLEREVSDLREKCGGPEGCCTSQQSKGAVCTTDRPATHECPEDCSDQGRCVDGKCVCFSGFRGPDCSTPECPDDCSGRGRCVDGQCVCDAGFGGPDCSERLCAGNCSNRGRCVNGRCVCDLDFSGPDCSLKTCPENCGSRGKCVNGKCMCESGFMGPDCSSRSCPGGCGVHGACVDGQCVCESGFTGPDCSSEACPSNCNSKGRCVDGKCVCDVGFSGQDCSGKTCPNSCSNRGRCVRGRCVCRRGFMGPDCSTCQSGFTGENCDAALAAVTLLGTRDISASSVTVFWTPPAVQYDTYHITFTSTKETDQKISSQISGRLSTYSQTGLAAGQRYMVSVTGEKDGLMGSENTAQFATLISGPKDLRVVKTSTTSAVVQWEKALGEIDRYVLSVAPNLTDGSNRLPEMKLSPDRDSAQIDGLEPGRLYDITLVAEKDGVRSRAATAQATPASAVRMNTTVELPPVDMETGDNSKKTPRFTNTSLFLRKHGMGNVKVTRLERPRNTSRLKPGMLTSAGHRRAHETQPGFIRRPYSSEIMHLNSSQMRVKGGSGVPSSNESVAHYPPRTRNAKVNSAYPASGGKPLAHTMKETRTQKDLRGEPVESHRSATTPFQTLMTSSQPITHVTEPTEEPTVTTERNLTVYINGTKCVRKVLVGYRKIHGNMSDGRAVSKNLSIIVGHVNGSDLLHKLLTEMPTGNGIGIAGLDEGQPRSMDEDGKAEERTAHVTIGHPEVTLEPSHTTSPPHPHLTAPLTLTRLEQGNQHAAGHQPIMGRPARKPSLSILRQPPRTKPPGLSSPRFMSTSSSLTLETHKSPSLPNAIVSRFTKQPVIEVKEPKEKFSFRRELQDSTLDLAQKSRTAMAAPPQTKISSVTTDGLEASDLYRRTAVRASHPRSTNISSSQNRTRLVLEAPRHSSPGLPMRRPSKPINRTIVPIQPVKPALTSTREKGTSIKSGAGAAPGGTAEANSCPNGSQHGKANSDHSVSKDLLVDSGSEIQEYVLSGSSIEHMGLSNTTSALKHFTITQAEKEQGEDGMYEENGEGEAYEGSRLQNNNLSIGKSAVYEPNALITKTNKSEESLPKPPTAIPGSARSPHKSLRPQSRISVSVFGKGPMVRSKAHTLVIHTGPEPPTDLTFSDVTDSSFTVSWTKPKSLVSGFKITHTHVQEGEPISVSVDSESVRLSLSPMSPGSTYEVSVMSLLGQDESDSIKDIVTTLPDPPTDLRAINVTDSSALLLWRPALATVDHYIILFSPEAAPGSGRTISVSGNAVEEPLQALRPSTRYSVSIQSRLGDKSSLPMTAAFTTGGRGGDDPRDLSASQVTPRTAVLSWKPPETAISGYRLSYQTDGQDTQEELLQPAAQELKLSRLRPASTYTATLQAQRGALVSSAVSTRFTTGSLRFPFPADCSQEKLNGAQQSGVVEVFPQGSEGSPLAVYCDMETDGGGWTVFQRRQDGRTDFFRSWREYSSGFGALDGEFWLGNELLHNLTKTSPVTLRIDLRAGDEAVFARYSSFSVDNIKKHYTLRVSGYSGTAGDSMAYHNGRPFSTRDRDPRPFITRCAMSYRGGWWYKNCHEANLNGLYNTNTNHQGVIWTAWKGNDFSIPFTEMKFRPSSFRP